MTEIRSNDMKRTEFRKLAEDVSRCKVCSKMSTVPHLISGEVLENDLHGLDTDTPYVNRWNLWHGDLNADIMVIGQDYGTKENGENLSLWNTDDHSCATNETLKELFEKTFKMDIDEKNTSLFFTNMANCYRKNSTTGSMHPGWLPICANKFMGRLIKIIRPKIIIVLGKSAFEALYCMDELTVECRDPRKSGKTTFSEIIKRKYQIDLDGQKIAVFPVYHTGANSKRNRTSDEQLADWKRIADYYEKIKK